MHRRTSCQRHLHVGKKWLTWQPASVARSWPNSSTGTYCRGWRNSKATQTWNVGLHLALQDGLKLGAQQLVLLRSQLLHLLLQLVLPIIPIHGLAWNAQLQQITETHRRGSLCLSGCPFRLARSSRYLLRRREISEPTPILRCPEVNKVFQVLWIWSFSKESCIKWHIRTCSQVHIVPRISSLCRGGRCAVATVRRARLIGT
mmetsp:Transcript_9831/g.23629  ORF Transcript_9831/g.23629 Transcript_9831/m.23629 type:complete len:202 (-) Transcript_9831:240-845(-)